MAKITKSNETTPEGCFSTRFIAEMVLAVLACLLFVSAGFAWHCGWVQEHLRKAVLQEPIRFEKDFTLNSSFLVAYEHFYWVEVVCPREDSSRSRLEDVISALCTQLPVEFTITGDGRIVAQGDSPGEKNRTGSAAEDTRIITQFKAEPGKRYDLSFRTVAANSALDATKPRVRISSLGWTDSNLFHMVFANTTPSLFLAVAGLLVGLSPFRFFTQKNCSRKAGKTAV